MSLADELNLGPKSAEMLSAVGIHSLEDLRDLGSVNAYLFIKQSGSRPSLNLLWAMHGALTGQRWNMLSDCDKQTLIAEMEALTQTD